MFLSKKNAIYFNKPKQQDPTKPKRILGGWQDDEEQKDDKIDYKKKQQLKPKISSQNLLEGDDIVMTQQAPVSQQNLDKPQTKEVYYLDWDELDAKADIQCEKKLVEEIVQPGGIRIKPSEAQLAEFLKQSKAMDTHIIGSLLLSKIQVNYPFQVKAKALYAIEHLAKKNEKYAAYFKAQSQKIRDFPEPEDNTDNYKKILKQTLNTIGINASSSSAKNEPELTFVDPGYNDQPAKRATDMKMFITENAKKQKKTEPKRAIIGPGQTKKGPSTVQQQANDDILGLDLLGTGSSNSQPNISFDQLLGQTQANSLI